MIRYLIRETPHREKLVFFPYNSPQGELYYEYKTIDKVLQYQEDDGTWVDVETVKEEEEKSNG